jgi:DNA-binding winged helix-turn-helix (wHTH) protein
VKTFGDFEFDDRRRGLTAGGQPVRLSGQAVDLLCLLLERPGDLITREEIERRLWPDRTVDFHHSLDVVVNRLRTALNDRGASPRYIETVPRKGYRFVEPVTARSNARPATKLRRWKRAILTYAAVAILAAILAILFARTRYDKVVPSQRSQTLPTPVPIFRPVSSAAQNQLVLSRFAVYVSRPRAGIALITPAGVRLQCAVVDGS